MATLFGTRKKRDPWRMAPEPPAYQGGYDLTDQDLTPQPTMPSTMPTTPQSPEPQGMMGGRRPGFWGGGDKFTARDGIAAALAVVGDAFSNRAGMPVGATQMLAGGRMDALELAKAEQEKQAEDMRLTNLLQTMDLTPQQREAARINPKVFFENYGKIFQPQTEKTTPYRFKDNAGNVHELDPATGQTTIRFVDPNERFYFQDGMMVRPNNAYLGTTPPATPRPAPPSFEVGGERFSPPVYGQSGPTRIRNAQDYEALPPGAEYIDPNGVRRRKRGS